jgi:RimJ/RimL family protein N-acetyltransferase
MSLHLALPEPLGDGRMLLRHWRDEDAPQIVAGFGHPSVLARSWALSRPYTVNDAHDYLAADREARRAGDEVGFAIADPAEPARLFGGGSLYDVDRDQRRAAIGYWLAPAARGRGYATAAVMLAAGWALAPTGRRPGADGQPDGQPDGRLGLGLGRLEITCAPDNLASRRVAERAGFTYEARLRDHVIFRGEPRDSLVLGRLAASEHPA